MGSSCSFVLSSAGFWTHGLAHNPLPALLLTLMQDDFFGPEIYGPDGDDAWQRYMNNEEELLLTCHIYHST